MSDFKALSGYVLKGFWCVLVFTATLIICGGVPNLLFYFGLLGCAFLAAWAFLFHMLACAIWDHVKKKEC
ncbi:hypothetical protein [Pantoea phytobeneficialis]|uniref:Uncharacterized protein n=1 Tax=Pantoea phytobeneficialis TaxID=2052056 RepID=A0ABT8XSR7_9GAMM|nr:hypothetical protein [Pantoea phytobeneficialis]MDO6406469.1 hypothetical protein [Pantoea phytobeneficialis]